MTGQVAFPDRSRVPDHLQRVSFSLAASPQSCPPHSVSIKNKQPRPQPCFSKGMTSALRVRRFLIRQDSRQSLRQPRCPLPTSPKFPLPLEMKVKVLVAQSCPNLSDPVDRSPPGSSPLSLGFSRQEYWSGLPFPPAGDLPGPGITPRSPALPADSLPSEPPQKTLQRRKLPK